MLETDILDFIVLSWLKHQSKSSRVSFAKLMKSLFSCPKYESLRLKVEEGEEPLLEIDISDKFERFAVLIQTPSDDFGDIMLVISM